MQRHLLCTLCSAALVTIAGPQLGQAQDGTEEVLLGLGYDRSRDGHGFELHKVGETYALYFYTYDSLGDPEWFLGLAEMQNGILSGPLRRYTYDEALSPAQVEDPAFEGEFRLDFTRGLSAEACEDGVDRDGARQVSEFFWRIQGESGTWCTEFLSVGGDYNRDPYYGGVWYAGPEDAGYGVTMTHMSDAISALIYYYDAAGNPRWSLGTAPDSAPAVEMQNYRGFCRSCTPRPPQFSPNGTLGLDWSRSSAPGAGDDMADIDVTYPLPPFGDFQKTFTLTRLSDGETTGRYEIGFLIEESVEYAAVWQANAFDGNGSQVRGTRDFGAPFAERTLNPIDSNAQNRPAVGIAANGSYVVVWEGDADGNGAYQIKARGFNADGSERFPIFTVNSEGAGQQRYPDIAVAPNGDFVVVWEDDSDGNRYHQILARGFNANGSQKFGDIEVNNRGAGNQEDPAVAIDDDGNFVVVWADDQNANEFYDISARAFRANGSAYYGQFEVNNNGAGHHGEPDVAMDEDGNYTVVWSDDADLNQFTQVRGRGFFLNGSERAAEFTVNQNSTASQYQPSVAAAPNGDFAVVWIDQGARVATRAFLANGQPAIDELVVSTDSLPLHGRPTVGMAGDGTLLLLWEYLRADGRFRIAGRPVSFAGQTGGEFLVSTTAESSQIAPVISVR